MMWTSWAADGSRYLADGDAADARPPKRRAFADCKVRNVPTRRLAWPSRTIAVSISIFVLVSVAACQRGPTPLDALEHAVDQTSKVNTRLNSPIEWHAVVDVSGSYRAQAKRLAAWLDGLPIEKGDQFCVHTFAQNFLAGNCVPVENRNGFLVNNFDRLFRTVLASQQSSTDQTDIDAALLGARNHDEADRARPGVRRRFYIFVTDGQHDPRRENRHVRLFSPEEPHKRTFANNGRDFVSPPKPDPKCLGCGAIGSRYLYFVIDAGERSEVEADWMEGQKRWAGQGAPWVTFMESENATLDVERVRRDARREPAATYLLELSAYSRASALPGHPHYDFSLPVSACNPEGTVNIRLLALTYNNKIEKPPVHVSLRRRDIPGEGIGPAAIELEPRVTWKPVGDSVGGWQLAKLTLQLKCAGDRVEGQRLPVTVRISLNDADDGLDLAVLHPVSMVAYFMALRAQDWALLVGVVMLISSVAAQLWAAHGEISLHLARATGGKRTSGRAATIHFPGAFANGARATLSATGNIEHFEGERCYEGPDPLRRPGQTQIDLIPWGARLYWVIWCAPNSPQCLDGGVCRSISVRSKEGGAKGHVVRPHRTWSSPLESTSTWGQSICLRLPSTFGEREIEPVGKADERIRLWTFIERDERARRATCNALILHAIAAAAAFAAFLLACFQWVGWWIGGALLGGALLFGLRIRMLRSPRLRGKKSSPKTLHAPDDDKRSLAYLWTRAYHASFLCFATSALVLSWFDLRPTRRFLVVGLLAILACGFQLVADWWVKRQIEHGRSLGIFEVIIELLSDALVRPRLGFGLTPKVDVPTRAETNTP